MEFFADKNTSRYCPFDNNFPRSKGGDCFLHSHYQQIGQLMPMNATECHSENNTLFRCYFVSDLSRKAIIHTQKDLSISEQMPAYVHIGKAAGLDS
jgi:hypothetical protein